MTVIRATFIAYHLNKCQISSIIEAEVSPDYLLNMNRINNSYFLVSQHANPVNPCKLSRAND